MPSCRPLRLLACLLVAAALSTSCGSEERDPDGELLLLASQYGEDRMALVATGLDCLFDICVNQLGTWNNGHTVELESAVAERFPRVFTERPPLWWFPYRATLEYSREPQMDADPAETAKLPPILVTVSIHFGPELGDERPYLVRSGVTSEALVRRSREHFESEAWRERWRQRFRAHLPYPSQRDEYAPFR